MNRSIHEPYLLSLLPTPWLIPPGHKSRPGRFLSTAEYYRTWLEAALAAGDTETLVYVQGNAPKRPLRWFAPGVPMIYLGYHDQDGQRWQLYRFPVAATLAALDFELVHFITPKTPRPKPLSGDRLHTDVTPSQAQAQLGVTSEILDGGSTPQSSHRRPSTVPDLPARDRPSTPSHSMAHAGFVPSQDP